MGLNFDDVTGITPGDEDAYARVLIGLWQDPGLWQNADGGETMRRFLKERCVPDAAAQWVYDAAQWAYDGRVVANARRDVVAHPGLGEERINDAARIVVSAIGAGRSQRDPRMALSGVFENPSLTREAIDSAMRVASLLPDFIVNSMLRGGALTGDDVRALWGSRSENRSYMGLGRDFVEPAVCGGSAPNSLVEEWLNRDEYAPHAAAYAADVSEDDVLRIVHSVDNPLRDRALINPVLSSEALWSEMRQRRVLGDGLTYVFANESAHPAMLEAAARDSECKEGWESIAGNPVAPRAAFETLLFTGSNDKLRLLQKSGRNPGFPPALVWDVHRVFDVNAALCFANAPQVLLREIANAYGEMQYSLTSIGSNVSFHCNCPPDVRANLAWHDRALWPLVADDAYRGRHVKASAQGGATATGVSSLFPLCG